MENKPYLNIADTARMTGLSQYYLRRGCRAGTVPHIRCGTVYKIDVSALLEKLGIESRKVGGNTNDYS